MRLRAAVTAAAVALTLASLVVPTSPAGGATRSAARPASRTVSFLDGTAARLGTTALRRCTQRQAKRLAHGTRQRCSLSATRVRICVHRADTRRGKRLCRAALRRRTTTTTTTTTTVTVPPADPTAPTTPGTADPTAPTAPAGSSTEFAFLSANSDGSPARWNPCKPITWRYNPAGAPDNALVDLATAMSQVSAASGLPFSYAGTTADRPFRNGATHPGGEDLLIGFGDATEYPDMLAGSTIGYGGPYGKWMIVNGVPSPIEYIAGDVLLDTQNGLAAGFGAGLTFGNLVLHEVGHAMGLGHVNAAQEIMNPATTPSSPNGYAAGDLAGLQKLGRSAGCFASPLR